MNSLMSYPKSLQAALIGLVIVAILMAGCQGGGYDYYRKSFSQDEARELAQTLTDGIGNYYQGSPGCQLLLEEAKGFDPTYALAYREIGVPYLKRGVTAAFPHYYGKAAVLDPLGWTGWRGYLYLYFYRDYERALVDFNALDTITPGVVDYPQSTSVDYMRALCHLQLGNYDAAIDYLDLHIAHEDTVAGFKYIPPEAFLFRGIAYWKKGDADEAIQSFLIGHDLEDYNADLMFWLAKVYSETGKLSEARRWFRAAEEAFQKRDYNRRFYVEEFHQLYEEDFVALRAQLE